MSPEDKDTLSPQAPSSSRLSVDSVGSSTYAGSLTTAANGKAATLSPGSVSEKGLGHVHSKSMESFATYDSQKTYESSELYNEETSTSASRPSRADLNKEIGADNQLHSTEIVSFPCAGIRVPHGRLKGLFAWKFGVQLPETPDAFKGRKVIANFILDLGCRHSPVAAETLEALGYAGDMRPGVPVTLLIQGVKTRCVVAYPGEASRLSATYVVNGELTFYFDGRLNAPVLYVDDSNKKPAVDDIPKTIRKSFHSRVMSVISLIRPHSPP